MWHKATLFAVLLVLIAHEYVDASGHIPKKYKRQDIFKENEHYLTDPAKKFPDRLTCFECDSKDDPDCISNPSEEKIVDCFYPSMCYHALNATSGETQRGCTKDIDGYLLERCEGNQEECKVCKGTNCNDAPEFVKCTTCSSSTECAILGNPKNAKPKICSEYRDKCFTYIGREGVERGCLASKSELFQEKCKSSEDKCSLCQYSVNGRECNRQKFDLEFCVECDSTTNNVMCKERPSLFRNKICNTITSNDKPGCYLSMKGDVYQKGCVRDLNTEDNQECNGQSDECKTCHFTNCNAKKDFASCAVCNSKDNVQCSGNFTGGVCTDYMSLFCFRGVDQEGYTHRRCVSESEAKTHGFKPNKYKICSEPNCNNKTYPEGRLECYQCEGDQCNDLTNSSLEPAACAIYSTDNQCYTYVGEDKKVQRGCLADSAEMKKQCDPRSANNGAKCVKCNGNGCNDNAV